MKEKEQIFELSEDEKLKLRLWCMKRSNQRMYEIYQWLLDSNSIEELEFKKEVNLLSSGNYQAGTFQEQYLWIVTGIIPPIATETLLEPIRP